MWCSVHAPSIAGQLRYEQGNGFTMIYADVDGDAVADYAIRVDGLVDLTVNDFIG